MRINIAHLGLPEFFDRKSDIIYVLFCALEQMGHNTSITHNKIERSALNIIVGSDIICNQKKALLDLINSKCDYAIFEVENFSGKTINYRRDFDLSGYVTLLRNSKFCFTPYIYNFPQLAKIVGENRTVYTKWGFHPSMICHRITRGKIFHHTALFYGLIKADREKKIRSLSAKLGGEFQVINQDDAFSIRDYYITKCKLGLSLSYGEYDNFVNPFRVYHMLANGMPVLSDHKQDDDGYTKLCDNMAFEELINSISDYKIDNELISDKCNENRLSNSLSICF